MYHNYHYKELLVVYGLVTSFRSTKHSNESTTIQRNFIF